MTDLKSMLDPQNVALIGATEDDGTVGRSILDNLLSSDKRKIFPVNPKRETILGQKCFPSIGEVPEQVDLAIIVTPAETVPAIVEECGKAGVNGAIIISAGFKETGEKGRLLEEKIREIREKYGMRIIGPNCIGVIRTSAGLNTSFLKATPQSGNIAFISQSGALGSAICDWAIHAHVGFSMFASLGSMVDVDFGDLIDFLGEDPYTRSIILYMESVGNAKKFMSAARGFSRNKPIIIIKPGRFTESAKAAHSHTGALAGDDQVYDAAFKRVGIIRVKEFSDLFNAAKVLDSNYLPKGPKLAIVTNAGGFGVMATDALIEMGGQLAVISEAAVAELDRHLPPFWSKSNPIDVLGDADEQRYCDAIQVCLKDSDVDGVLVIYSPQAISSPEKIAQSVQEIAQSSRKPVITSWVGGENVKAGKDFFYRHDVPTYDTPEEAVKTYLNMYHYSRNLALLYETPSELSLEESPPKFHLKALIKRVIKEGRTLLTEEESKSFLSIYDIPVTIPSLCHHVEEAIGAASEIQYPVVLKIVSPDIVHKSDVGGVITGIKTREELEREYQLLMENVQKKAPQAKIAGVTVQKMLEDIDYEVILGTKKDKDFGSVIMFGMGGTQAEIFRDISIGIPPLNQKLSQRLIEETRVFKMLQGFRGRTPANMEQLEKILVNFSNLVVDFPEILEMDINPLAIANGKAFAVDARIILDRSCIDYTSQYPHLILTPYPKKYIMNWKMKDGTEVALRPIKPEDEHAVSAMLSSLSPETIRSRFFSPVRHIPREMLVRFCNIDYEREMALVAELRDGEGKRIIGISRLIIDPDLKGGEHAVLVHDAFQGKGLGYKLVDMIIGFAQDKGLNEIYGVVLKENERMLRVAKEMGFVHKSIPDGLMEVRLKLK